MWRKQKKVFPIKLTFKPLQSQKYFKPLCTVPQTMDYKKNNIIMYVDIHTCISSHIYIYFSYSICTLCCLVDLTRMTGEIEERENCRRTWPT
jgi:hypothetical protein